MKDQSHSNLTASEQAVSRILSESASWRAHILIAMLPVVVALLLGGVFAIANGWASAQPWWVPTLFLVNAVAMLVLVLAGIRYGRTFWKRKANPSATGAAKQKPRQG